MSTLIGSLVCAFLLTASVHRNPEQVRLPMDARSFFVAGHVEHPGRYKLWKETVAVNEAIDAAGGLTIALKDARIEVIRMVNGKKVRRETTLDAEVEPADVIDVQKNLRRDRDRD